MHQRKDGNKELCNNRSLKIALLIITMLFVIISIIKVFHFGVQKSTNTLFNSILSENLSPNNRYKAVVFSRDLGLTTSISYQLSILKANEKLKNKPGNTFISYSKFNVEWIDHKEIRVIIEDDKTIFKQNYLVEGISVTYMAKYND